ncbi:efflux RND transporter periplasmic adaptor subunit [Acidiphilium acidophilum]|uniref:Efflux RND transporter periplasmic adaptor subunit n=1 Tax=Acidiphilium acidophilum TaxID=76588 RepID=A0AAW9DLM5_ACIAO|nr:efflux RND transporter periplasmic adaptor subunit [Acidiphilium acidophilum]MDX5929921.1 efflux RND transporter periplasmic adaptor subunit [Acidiphilium acidophilum]GBQ21937.1 membrane-fusion protein [Acidiphilium acidophilum DSM 700]
MTAQDLEPTSTGPLEPKPAPVRVVGARPPRRPSVTLRMIIMLILVGIVLFLIFGFGAFRTIMIGKFLATLKNPPQTVATMVAKASSFQPEQNSTGTLIAEQGANLSAEVAGIVDTISFKSGQNVKKGQVLLTLRPNNDQALLAQLRATASLDQVTYQRDLAQYRAQAVSMQTVDTDRANLASAQANVNSQLALMAEKTVKAPFSGRIGIRAVDLGEYLAAGTTIASLQKLNPIDIDFYLPQAALRTIRPGMAVQVTIESFGTTPFDGKIIAIDSAVSATTRMIQIRAQLTNPHDELRPGMFARVAIAVGAPEQVVTLPQTAIAYNSFGDTVFIVKRDKSTPASTTKPAPKTKPGKTAPPKATHYVEQVFVTLGQTRGDQVAILKGVSPGDQVVVAGQVKLLNKSPVIIDNKIMPSDSPDPVVPNE